MGRWGAFYNNKLILTASNPPLFYTKKEALNSLYWFIEYEFWKTEQIYREGQNDINKESLEKLRCVKPEEIKQELDYLIKNKIVKIEKIKDYNQIYE